LVCCAPEYMGKRIGIRISYIITFQGTMLMAAALVWAVKVICEYLHLEHLAPPKSLHFTRGKRIWGLVEIVQAGGKSNVPAIRLYERFGFKDTSREQFNDPNENLYVLWDIHNSLQTIDWKTILQTKIAAETVESEQYLIH
jgi:GNAT superfamily N-acetyltransferase